jgi:glycine cleavage system transcriptional repressor
MGELAVTVIGHDRPGIIADVAEALSGLGLNLTDSVMTRLRGHFAMTLVCAGDTAPERVERALAPLTNDGSLTMSVRDGPPEEPPSETGKPYLLTVHGADRLGLVAAVARAVTAAGGNVTDLSTRLAGDLYLLIAEVDLPDPDVLRAGLAEVLDVEISLRAADTDLL